MLVRRICPRLVLPSCTRSRVSDSSSSIPAVFLRFALPPCPSAGEVPTLNDGQPVAGPSNYHGKLVTQRLMLHNPPQSALGPQSPDLQQTVAGGSQPPFLTVNTGTAIAGESISSASATPTSGPGSPNSYWLTVMGAEDSDS